MPKRPDVSKKTDAPIYFPISPVALVCPQCHAKPGKDCVTLPGGVIGIVHVSRIKAAAKQGHLNNVLPKKRA